MLDAAAGDDAAVYRIGADRALVATVDFFTPIVDDARDFGRIAAANALSDLYAKGARPLFALNLIAFPRQHLESGLAEEIVRGGGEVARQAGIAVVGGHSIDAPEPLYGLCAVGEVHPERLVRASGARAGDRLILTKALGTGVISTAIKAEKAPEAAIRAAVESMTMLNRAASEAMLKFGADAATDVTGFGLLGHLHQLLRASGAAARIAAGAVPLLPHALELAAAGLVPGGTARNQIDLGDHVRERTALAAPLRTLLWDAQTSGGLLIAVPPERCEGLLSRLRETSPVAAEIGEVVEGPAGEIGIAE